MKERIGLAEWIASLRAELEDAAQREVEREVSKGLVGSLALQEITLELDLETEVVTGIEGEAKSHLKFWIFAGADVSGKVDATRKKSRTQRVVLTLKPTAKVFLGADDEENLLNANRIRDLLKSLPR